MVRLLNALRAGLVWTNLLPHTAGTDDVELFLLSRSQALYRQLPSHVRYEASLTSLLLLPVGQSESGQALSLGNGTVAASVPSDVEDWIMRSRRATAKFDRTTCKALTVYNRRKSWRRGECHIEVTAAEEEGCKSVWSPMFQMVPGWWETVIMGVQKRSDSFHKQSPAMKEWLIEREITLMHIYSRLARCEALTASGNKGTQSLQFELQLTSSMLNSTTRYFNKASETSLARCLASSRSRTPLAFEVALSLAERDMASRGLYKPVAPGFRPVGKVANVFRIDALEGVCWLTESHECINGRKAEICA